MSAPRALGRALAAAAAGAVLALNADLHWLACLLDTRRARAAAFLAVAASGAVAAALLARLVAPRLAAAGRGRRGIGLAAALLCGVLLAVAIPVRVPRVHRLEIVPTGRHHPDAKGNEVWVLGLFRGDGSRVPVEHDGLPAGWGMRDDIPVALGAGAGPLRWEACVGDREVHLHLLSHPWSGIVEIRWDGRSETRDLYAPVARQSAIDVRLDAGDGAPARTLAGQLVAGAVFGLTLFLLAVQLGTGVPVEPAPAVGRGSALWPALVCAAVWILYLLAYWPGLMTSDSMDQWSQMLHPNLLNNHHSAVHTLGNWLVTRLWPSPAAVAVVQILALAGVVGLALREVAGFGVSWWPRALATAAIALSPVNGVMAITLWKDIPYTIAMLGTFTVVLNVVRTRGAALARPGVLVGLAVALLAVALYRHNGPPVAAGIVVVLAVAAPAGFRRRVVAAGLGVAVAFMVVTGPVFRAIGVRGVDSYFASAILIHQLGAFAADDVPLDASARDTLEGLASLERWREYYNCYSVNGVLWSMGINRGFFYTHIPEVRALWLRLLGDNPGLIVRHQWCATSMVWEITQPPGGYLFLFYANIHPNRFGLVQDPQLPALKAVLDDVLAWTATPANLWWAWRPALYLYLALFAGVIATLRRREPRTLLILLPVVLNSAVLMLVNVVQDFRYQYPVYLMALLLLPMIQSRPDTPPRPTNG